MPTECLPTTVPKVLITREDDPPYFTDGVVRANGYAFMFKEHWEGFDPSALSDDWKQGLREQLARARSYDPDRDWDRAKHPDGYVVNSCFFRGEEVVVPLEMLLDE